MRRATMSRADISEDGTTTSVYSLNLKSAQFYIALILALAALLAAFNTGAKVLVRHQIDMAIKQELSPPDGDIYRAISVAIATHQHETERVTTKQFSRIDIRLAYQELLVSEMYTEVTGRPLPPAPVVTHR